MDKIGFSHCTSTAKEELLFKPAPFVTTQVYVLASTLFIFSNTSLFVLDMIFPDELVHVYVAIGLAAALQAIERYLPSITDILLADVVLNVG